MYQKNKGQVKGQAVPYNAIKIDNNQIRDTIREKVSLI
jgi:hypothetical protein